MHYEKEGCAAWMFWRKRRYVVALLAFCGFLISYILRVNLSIAIVKMTENHTIVDESGNVSYYREFDWDSRLRGHVLSSFFYGYMCTPILGGWLAARIGGKQVVGLGIAAAALFTIITPLLTRCSVYLLIAVRVVEGLFEGVTFSAMSAIMANWAPPLERTKLTIVCLTGSIVGPIVAMPTCGLMAERLGWPSVFYSFGAAGLLWYACWCYIARNRPQDDPRIGAAELKYIVDSLGSVTENTKVLHPWRLMLSSPVVWAIIVANFSENWGYYTMITQLPIFINDVLNFKLEDAGFLAALPYLLLALVLLLSSHLADWLRSRKILSTTQVRRSFTCGAFVCQAIFMTCTAYVMTPIAAISCLTIAVGFSGFAYSGFSVNYLDIAPKHASVLCGIGITVASLSGIISPIITGYIVQDNTIDGWRVVFFISSAFYLIGAVIYGIFSSGEEQPWAVTSRRNSENQCQYDNPALEVNHFEI